MSCQVASPVGVEDIGDALREDIIVTFSFPVVSIHHLDDNFNAYCKPSSPSWNFNCTRIYDYGV